MQAQQQLTPQKGGGFRFWLEILLGVGLVGWGGFVAWWVQYLASYLYLHDMLMKQSTWCFLAHGGACLLGGLACLIRWRMVAAWMMRIAAMTLGIVTYWFGVYGVMSVLIYTGITLFLFLTAHWLSRGE
jgi:hypothetical protein